VVLLLVPVTIAQSLGDPGEDLFIERQPLEDCRKALLQEQRQREAVLTRQRAIDEAIQLRKEEIEGGKPNPRLSEQRRSNTEIDKAVSGWEQAYRREVAEKKAAEARKQLAEIERARTEEQRRREAEALARKAQEEKDAREAFSANTT
jgi:hypothetical protein